MFICGKSAGKWGRLAVLAAALLVPATAPDGAEIKRIHPPYPDVWGRMLPFPNLGNGHYYINSEARERPDGTIFLNTYSSPRRAPSSPRSDPVIINFHTFDFFTGALRDTSKAEYLRLQESKTHKKLKRPWFPSSAYRWRSWNYTGKDGKKFAIERVIEFGLQCPYLSVEYADHFYVLRDAKGAALGERMLLGLFERPVPIEIWKFCPQRKIKTHFMARWRDIAGNISRLRDGTLLIHGNFPFVIRINRDFTSPYLAAHDKLFWVDRAVIKTIRDKASRLPGLPLQNVNDAIYDYLMTLK